MKLLPWTSIDSYCFVPVTMLSTCNDRIGGQTALRNENGEVMNVKRATNGMHPDRHIPVPQTRKDRVRSWFERYIEHKALRALGIPK
jgi:hypothetical protein